MPFSESLARTQTASQERNPFNIILSKFQEAQARRYSEDKERKKEEFELSKALEVLNKDYLYKTELEKIKGEEERKTKIEEQERETTGAERLLKTFGMGNNLPPGTTAKMGNLNIPLNRELTQEQGLSIAGSEMVEKDVTQLKALIEKHAGEKGSIAKTTLPYFLVGGDTEEIKRISDQLRARIPFAKGGKQLTPFEAKTLFKLLPMPGQSKNTIIKNLDSFVTEFGRISEIAKTGTAATKPKSNSKTKAQLANEIAQANPDLSREQIIQKVNQEFGQ